MSSKHLFLTGYRGSGKSSVAKLLSTRLQLAVIDLDDEIETSAGKTIKEIFAEVGEPGFRDLETLALQRAVQKPRAIISLGGGTILRPENRACIKQHGVCVWLQVDAVSAEERLNRDPATGERRPALTNLDWRNEIQTQLELRRPLYAEAADFAVDTASLDTTEVTNAICSWLSQTIKD